ncbi:heavy metal-associated domain-containing protein [Sulfurovum sp.]|uniref:heavy-metal-associated domain-containing protein n=1 Tax=Sulfurovum sp. TaxID=1969726 RepID=UPI0025EB8D2E|nr:heavy metal-associated domain-containing protein [Sulfurovum sp.]
MFKYFIILVFPLLLLSAEKTATIKIEGMTCPLCTTAVKKSLKKVDGVIKAKVRLNTKTAIVQYKGKVKEKTLLEAIKRTGYKGTVISVK